jgi:hypothetical protein
VLLMLGMFGGGIQAALSTGPARLALLRILRVGLLSGLLPTAVAGLVAVFGFSGLLVVLVLLGTSPAMHAAVRLLWHPASDPSGSSGPHASHVEAHSTREDVQLPRHETWTSEQLASLDDASLCLAWRRTFVQLEAASSVEDRVAVVWQRQLCLDELQRRCPDGVAAWLSSGARAGGNPLPFLEDRPPRSA